MCPITAAKRAAPFLAFVVGGSVWLSWFLVSYTSDGEGMGSCVFAGEVGDRLGVAVVVPGECYSYSAVCLS